jgi:nitrogen fixation negative regulator NifL
MSKVAKLSAAPAAGDPPAETSATTVPPEVYGQAVEQADIGISITDTKANILYCNAAFARTTGYGREEAQGCNQSMLSYKTTPTRIYEEMWAHLKQGQPWHGRLLNRRKDGSPYLAELSITPVQAADGQVHHYLGMHRDVTAMHQLEQRVRNQKQLIESVIDAAPMAIALLDEAGKVLLDNQAYKKLVADLGVPEPADLLLAALAKATTPGKGGGIDVRIDRAGGRAPRWFCCTTQMLEIHDESADGFFDRPRQPSLLLIASDVTALHAEQEKARAAALKAMLAEEEHAATLRESLSAALYQIEEPINVIASAVALMRGRGEGMMAGVLDEAVAGARARIEELRGLLPAERRGGQNDEAAARINLNEVVRDVLDISTQRLLAAGITVDWQPEPVLPVLLGSPLRLRSVVKTLLDNAIDAIAGSRAGKGKARREIAMTTQARRDGVVLTLDDSGPGIPPELRLKVFEPFFSASGQVGRHLGTGLSRAQQIAADHGGIIDILDAPQGGCRVRVELPTGRSA